ncbi:ABC transporter permease [Fodinibius sediminis]|uniref:ABC-2 type transport system permease protein n=1 Tax=Fodinibius sediminis TaxID=1214077 RepID=A0A521DZI8_9BACT|nr:ABC transporter permease [Fodinibius sediminis]SMO77139.1 ABC-2 type transport system permease protein [Fodinibius sediminis]
MRTIKFLLQKEFLQIFRNKSMLPIIFVMPVIQLVVLSFAATYELKEVDMHLVDFDRSGVSRQLVTKMQASGYFTLRSQSANVEEGITDIRRNKVQLVLVIPPHFERDLRSGRPASVQMNIDAVDGATAGLIQAYGRSIIQDFDAGIRPDVEEVRGGGPGGIDIIPASWYNPNLDYIKYMVPGILVVLVAMIGMFLSGMNIVREREIGTIEQLNVTPIRRYQFMLGKLLPFWIIALFELALGLLIARFGFDIPFVGSVWLLFGIAGIFMLVVQGLGLLISTVTHTQQQAMFIAWFLMVIFILMGGLFTPIESMPVWARELTLFNPMAHFIKIMRMVLLKGAGWNEIQHLAGLLALMAAVILPAAVFRYRKSTG